MRIRKEKMEEAVRMRERGKSMEQIASHCFVHVSTMRRYLRNYETYGDSLWTMYPTDETNNASS